MKSMGWHIAVERLRDRARSWGASSGLSTALSLGFGALLLALALAGPQSDSDATGEPATPTEMATPEPPAEPEPSEATDETMPPVPVSLAMARIALPPPPPAAMAAEVTSTRAPSPTTEARTLPPDIESTRPSPPASEPAPMKPLTQVAAKPLPPEAPAARPALAPPAPTPAAEPALARRSEPAEKMPVQTIPVRPIKALETELARETKAPARAEPPRQEPKQPAPPRRAPEAPSQLSAVAATPSVAIRVGDEAAPEAVEGRVLLHILEHGSGPGIVIAWPRSAKERAALYSLLAGCYGVRTALLDSSGRLYRADRARAWSPNTDRYSGFLRQVEGQLPASERGTVAAIHRQHPGLRSSSTVRLFPRNVDAVLLGGLRGIVGERYGDASRISARYSRSGQRVVVENIRVDGAALRGTVALTPPRYCPAAGST